jgi:2-polyprenyl-3-methyl-5-hydroxy-6-metoxy-1,4-benzoquinol methylase
MDLEDAEMEGYVDPSRQRDLSIKFQWAHDHDFGDFVIKGLMGDRHVALVAAFVDLFHTLPLALDGMRILDIGCWTGGSSLLMAAMGAHVVAIDEVKKYIDCLTYVRDAFAIDRLEPRNLSLYDLTDPEFEDGFDYVLFGGVLYHLSDPIIGLRITFNVLKPGGSCLLETATVESKRLILGYAGPTAVEGGTAEERNRAGWNWFLPSPPTLSSMMADVGFTEIEMRRIRAERIFAVGVKQAQVDMTRAGLSVRSIR